MRIYIPLLIILTIIMTILLFVPNVNILNRDTIKNMDVETTDFDTLKSVVTEKLNSRKSTIFMPFKKDVLNELKKALDDTKDDMVRLQRISALTPYTNKGLYDINTISPSETANFQFENGSAGWYWSYGTFVNDTLEHTYNFMYYIVRLELGSPDIRTKFSLEPGETTVYLCSMGVGRGSEWFYNPLSICRGSFKSTSEDNFVVTSLCDSDNAPSIKLTCNYNIFTVDLSFTDTNGVKCKLSATSVGKKAFLNAKNGCAPCKFGLGTNYWSYPHMSVTINSISISDKINKNEEKLLKKVKGDGWMDRQWMKSDTPNTGVVQLISNIVSSRPVKNWGLGKYIWINLHLDGVQYMVYGFPSENEPITEGTIIKNSKYNIYYSDDETSKLGLKPTIKISKTRNVKSDERNSVLGRRECESSVLCDNTEDVVFPVRYEITVKDMYNISHVYDVDATGFGDCVTYDQSGNLHWAGSTIVKESGVPVGTGFIEANQFGDFTNYKNIIIKGAGIPMDKTSLFNTKNTIFQAIPSIVVMIVYASMVIYLITKSVIYIAHLV